MRPSELFKNLYFHDSPVDALVYSPENRDLRLKIDLCNFMQEDYQEGEPDFLEGELTIRGIKAISFDPEPLQIVENGSIGGEILRFDAQENTSQDEFEDICLVLEVSDYPAKTHTTVAIEMTASEVEWVIIGRIFQFR